MTAPSENIPAVPGPEPGSVRRRGRPRRRRLEEGSILGLPELKFLEDYLDELHRRYDHANRVLFFDDLVVALLLAFYNPLARSLRGIEDASQLPGIQQHLGADALRRSTLSDALSLFDPHLLKPLITELRRRLPDAQIDEQGSTLRGMLNRLLLFDGSYFRLAADVHWALHQRHGREGLVRAKVRLNLHLEDASGLPAGMSLSGQGDPSEPQALLEGVKAHDIVVADRGCFSHDGVERIVAAKADFVLRLQRSVVCTVIQERPLSPQDIERGILSDQIVLLEGGKNHHQPRPLRLVTVRPNPGGSARGQPPGQEPGEPIRLLTSIQDDTPAWVIGTLYLRRWDIELFFRWLKACVRWEHLLSHNKNGILIQFYVAFIGTMLLSLFSGQRPDRYAYNLVSLALSGYGTLADVLRIYEKRQRECQRDRERQRRRRAAKKQA